MNDALWIQYAGGGKKGTGHINFHKSHFILKNMNLPNQ